MSAERNLPQAARDKLAALRRRAADASALASSMTPSIQGAEGRARVLASARDAARHAEPADVERAEQALREVERELTELRDQRGARMQRARADGQTAARVTAWLDRQRPDATFEVVSLPRIRPSENVAAALESIRGEIADLRRQAHELAVAPLPPDELRERAREQVRTLAERGRPALTVDGARFNVAWRRRDAATSGATVEDVAAFAAWLMPDAMVAALDREIDALRLPGAVGEADRAAEMRRIADAFACAECYEECLIEQAREQGTDVPRRPDASPLAILGIRIVGAAASRAA